MSEKLYKAKCPCKGHGHDCYMAKEMHPSKMRLSKIRRSNDKKIINLMIGEAAL